MSPLVIDASISLKWVLDDEEFVAQAAALRDRARQAGDALLAPSSWLQEITNGLIVAARRKRVSVDAGKRYLVEILSAGVQLVNVEALEVYDAAFQHDIAGYDVPYVVLAQEYGFEFWTGDRRLYENLHRQTDLARWVGDFR